MTFDCFALSLPRVVGICSPASLNICSSRMKLGQIVLPLGAIATGAACASFGKFPPQFSDAWAYCICAFTQVRLRRGAVQMGRLPHQRGIRCRISPLALGAPVPSDSRLLSIPNVALRTSGHIGQIHRTYIFICKMVAGTPHRRSRFNLSEADKSPMY